MTTTATTALPTTPWYKRLWAAIFGAAKTIVRAIFEIVAPAVIGAAIDWVNHPANQAAAVAAVHAAIARGLKGDRAWTYARDELLDTLGDTAWDIAANWIDTLLQNAYFAIKNTTAKSVE